MSIDEIVHAWKSDEESLDARVPANPVEEELSEEELQQIVGSARCTFLSYCDENYTCSTGCLFSGTAG